MRALNLKLIRDLYRAKGLLIAITSILGVGIMCFVSLQSAYHNLEQARLRYYRQCRMADFWVQLKKAPVAELQALDGIVGIAQYDVRIQFEATVELENARGPINALVQSLPQDDQPSINDIVLRQGDYFSGRRREEVIINDAFARRHKLYPGQSIHLLLNQQRLKFTIVGTAISSEFTYLLGPGALIPDPDRFGVFYIPHRYAEEVFDFEGAANQVVGRFSPGSRSRGDEILQQVENRLEPFGVLDVTSLERQASNYYLTNEIAGLGTFATIVPSIFLAVAALVLNVLIRRMTRQQRTIVGTLKALGYSDWQVFFHFLQYGLAVGLLGGILGCAAGYGFSIAMTDVYRDFFEFPDLRSGFYGYTHAIGMSVSLACAVSGTILGARAMLKLRPAEAMRPAPPRRGGAIILERFRRWWSGLSPMSRSALRSVFRHRQRTVTGLFACCMGAGLLVNGFMMTEAQDYLLEFQFQRVLRSDLDLSYDQTEGIDALDEVRHLPAVDMAEPLLGVSCTLINGSHRHKGAITGLVPQSTLSIPRDDQGQPIPIPESGLVLSRQLASKLRVRPGDWLTMVPSRGQQRPVRLPVRHVADSYLGLSCYAEIHYLSRLIDEELATTGAQLRLNPDPQRRRELFRQLAGIPGIRSVTSQDEIVRHLTQTLLKNQYVFILALIGFAGVIFFGSILNASLVNLAERQREVATFRALGYTPWQVGAIFLRESLLVNLTGSLLGLPVGYGLMWLTAVGFNNELIRIPVVSAPWIWLVTMLISLAFALMAHAVVQWSLYRLDFLEALQTKE